MASGDFTKLEKKVAELERKVVDLEQRDKNVTQVQEDFQRTQIVRRKVQFMAEVYDATGTKLHN